MHLLKSMFKCKLSVCINTLQISAIWSSSQQTKLLYYVFSSQAPFPLTLPSHPSLSPSPSPFSASIKERQFFKSNQFPHSQITKPLSIRATPSTHLFYNDSHLSPPLSSWYEFYPIGCTLPDFHASSQYDHQVLKPPWIEREDFKLYFFQSLQVV